MRAALRVIRLWTSQNCERRRLGLCLEREDGSGLVDVLYTDHDVEAHISTLCQAQDVSLDCLKNSAKSRFAVQTEFQALRTKAFLRGPQFDEVFAKVEAQLALVEASVSVQAFPHGRSSRKARPLKRKAFDAISEIQNEVQKMPKKLPKPMKDRYHTLSTNIAKFSNISEAYMPHKWVTKPMDVKGLQLADVSDSGTAEDIKRLCRQNGITPPSFSFPQLSYYVRYAQGVKERPKQPHMKGRSKQPHVKGRKLVTVLAIGVANLNNTPGSVAVYFELAVSVDPDHSMSIAFDSIQRTLSSRRVPCVMFTQSAKSKVALDFWKGKLTQSKKASVLTALFYKFDARFVVYNDVEDMALFL